MLWVVPFRSKVVWGHFWSKHWGFPIFISSLFVYVVLLFSNGILREARKLKDIWFFWYNHRYRTKCKQIFYIHINGLEKLLKQNLIAILPFKVIYFNDRFKYLGYILNPNRYQKQNWGWLLETVEARINPFCNKWLFICKRLPDEIYTRGGPFFLAFFRPYPIRDSWQNLEGVF